MAERTHIGTESIAPSGDGPGALERAIDRFSMLHVLAGRVLQAWTAWQESIAKSPVGERPDPQCVPWGLAEGVSTYKELIARKADRRARTPRMFHGWCRHYDAYDDMAFAVDRWRESLDAARESLPDIARWVDDERDPPLKRWTAEAQRLLGRFGGFINRYTEGDVPYELDSAGFETCMVEVYARLCDLKSIPRAQTKMSQQSPALERAPVDEAYGALIAFIDRVATLAHMARHPNSYPPQRAGPAYGVVLITWIDLTTLLSPEVRTAARGCYPAGTPPIRIGRLRPSLSVIEAAADELGVALRNAVYQGRKHPLDGAPGESPREVRERLGVRTLHDGWRLFENDWDGLTPDRRAYALEVLTCASIDFDELRVLAIREAEAAIGMGRLGPAGDRASEVMERVSDSVSASLARPLGATTRADSGPKQVTWQDVQVQLLALRGRGEPYTNVRDLAKRCGCTDGTIRKAIKRDGVLKGWQRRYRPSLHRARTQSLSEVVEDQAGQSKEGAPHQVVPDDEVDAVMARLMEQAKPEERSRLEAMSPETRRELARTCQEQFSDERSSLRTLRKVRRRDGTGSKGA